VSAKAFASFYFRGSILKNDTSPGGYTMAENNLFQQAQELVSNLTQQNGNADETEKDTARRAITAAYANATDEQKNQLQELEQSLQNRGLLDDSTDQLS